MMYVMIVCVSSLFFCRSNSRRPSFLGKDKKYTDIILKAVGNKSMAFFNF